MWGWLLVLVFVALAFTLAAPAAQAADRSIEDPLLSLFPTAHDLPGLAETGDSRYFADDLTALYDGGAMRFVKAGVIGASRRYFKLDGATAEVVVHKMRSVKDAEDFLASLCKDIKAKIESTTKNQLCFTASAGTAYGYVTAGSFLVSASFDRQDPSKLRSLLEIGGRRARAKDGRGK
jgi:hypothetical protein